MRILLVFVALLGMPLIPIAGLAQESGPITAFYGQWQGSGLSQTSDSAYFGMTARDFDVTLRPAGTGFSVEWTTVLRQGGDPNNPDVRRKSSRLTFVPDPKPGLYRASDAKDPLSGTDYAWARLDGRSLTVYVMKIDDDGRFNVQIYDRSLNELGMELRYTRIRDAEASRTVKGKLVKVAK